MMRFLKAEKTFMTIKFCINMGLSVTAFSAFSSKKRRTQSDAIIQTIHLIKKLNCVLNEPTYEHTN